MVKISFEKITRIVILDYKPKSINIFLSFSINFKCKVTTDSLAIIHQTVCLYVL